MGLELDFFYVFRWTDGDVEIYREGLSTGLLKISGCWLIVAIRKTLHLFTSPLLLVVGFTVPPLLHFEHHSILNPSPTLAHSTYWSTASHALLPVLNPDE